MVRPMLNSLATQSHKIKRRIIMTLPIATVERIAKEAGIPRISSNATKALIDSAEAHIKSVATKAYTYTQHAGRNTLKAEDIAAVITQ